MKSVPLRPLPRVTATLVRLARHGHRFTAVVLVGAAVVGIGVGIAAPETSPVTPTSTVVAAQLPTTTGPQLPDVGRADGFGGHGRGGRR